MKMKKYNLNYNKVINYFLDHIDWGNSLSAYFLKKMNFSSGNFFTILPDNAKFEQIEDLKNGGILPPAGPCLPIDNGSGTYQAVPNTKEALVDFVKDFLNQNSFNYCIGEDVLRGPTDKIVKQSAEKFLLYNNEIYYLLDMQNSIDEIEDVIWKSNALYHMFFVLTNGSHNYTGFLRYEDFDLIYSNVNYIIGSAYDGESYIIWEKTKE